MAWTSWSPTTARWPVWFFSWTATGGIRSPWRNGTRSRFTSPDRWGLSPAISGRREAALFDGRTLVVPEAVGTSDFFMVGSERLGVHPVLRLTPPRRQLGNLDPERVLVGHGEGVMADGSGALASALARSRRNAPRLFLKDRKLVLSGGQL